MNEQHINSPKPVRRKRPKPYPIMVVSAFFILLFAGLIGYLYYYARTNKEELINNSYNSRQTILAQNNVRGDIYASDGTVLAHTNVNEDGTQERVYPYQNMFAHIVGYSTNGKAGIEKMANYYLINSDISLSEKVADQASDVKYPGDNVYTTLDIDLQQTAYNALASRNGAIIVTDCKTGKILAMVSKPDFDPDLIQQNWVNLINSNSSELVNRATQGLYPPGSTFKIITTLEYLKENPDTYEDFRFNCTGSFNYDGNRIECYHGEVHGAMDLHSAFAKSCNSSFANIGVGLDLNKFSDTLDSLMFGEDLPLDLEYNKSSAKCTPDNTSDDTMQLSIGQGSTLMTPMHLNMITMAVANHGVLNKPYVIDNIQSADGKVLKKYSSENYKRLMTEQQAQILQDLMKGVVETGTASKLKGLSYTAAGKTGSAEFNSASDSHAWFTGFAPADDPQICVTVIVENAGSGGAYAVPMAKRVFDTYFGVSN